jgi:hypothetical protein
VFSLSALISRKWLHICPKGRQFFVCFGCVVELIPDVLSTPLFDDLHLYTRIIVTIIGQCCARDHLPQFYRCFLETFIKVTVNEWIATEKINQRYMIFIKLHDYLWFTIVRKMLARLLCTIERNTVVSHYTKCRIELIVDSTEMVAW